MLGISIRLLRSLSSEILPSDDPLDAPNFNPIDYINAKFPHGNPSSMLLSPLTSLEHSMADLDSVTIASKQRIAKTDEEILQSIRDQAHTRSKGGQDFVEAQKHITELYGKIKDIKSKAERSERMVAEICRDIKSLDFAKRNLTTTITTLKRLQMLSK